VSVSCKHLLCVVFAVAAAFQARPVIAQAPADPPRADERGFADKARDWAKEHQILERLQGDVDGWYPRLGGLKRGSGFGGGPGYRTHILDDKVLLDVSGAVSYRWYKAVDVNARWLQAWDKRVEVWTDYRLEDDPQEDFFGIGPATSLATRTSYTYRASDLSLRGELKPIPWLHVGTTLGYLHPWIRSGHDAQFPSIEELFSDATAPGLAEQPDFLHAAVFADADFRDAPGNPRRGGFYHAAYGRWDDRSFNAFDFRRFDANAIQHVPLNAGQTHIVSPRFGLALVNNAPGERVPFYFLPYVGGVDTVRAFREFRFSDENALWFGAEYRWVATKWVSLAVFTDAGKVTQRWDQMDLTNLRHAYGVGVLVHSSKQTFARLYIGGGGGEGVRTYLKLGL
jgi:hypothetical protein